MFPKTTVVILLYSYTTTSSDLFDLNFILRGYLNLPNGLQKTYYLNRRDKIMKQTAICGK
jgi:hypothetical protein